MIADLLEKAVGMSNEDILAEFKKHTLGELCSQQIELLHRRQEVRTIFGHLNSSFIDAESAGHREYETLVRLTDLVKVMIGRKHFDLHTAESTAVGKQPNQSELTKTATGEQCGPTDSLEPAVQQASTQTRQAVGGANQPNPFQPERCAPGAGLALANVTPAPGVNSHPPVASAAPSDLMPTSLATARTPQRGTAPGGDELQQRLVAAVECNFGCVGKPSFEAFYSAIEPKTITNSEFCAWKRGDRRHCGRAKWDSLGAAADKLRKPDQLATKL